jgi:hypothetical protein
VIGSSPTIGDVDGDHLCEVLVGTTSRDGGSDTAATLLVVFEGDGSLMWSKDVGVPITSAPAVGDIDGDGDTEVVVALGGDVSHKNSDGGVIAYSHGGTQLWRFYTQDALGDGFTDSVRSSPTLCDVDNDGDMEIAFGGWDRRMYLLDHEGNSLWDDPLYPGPGYFNADTFWSSAACADLNRDGYREIIIGADITHGVLPDGSEPEDGGFLYVFDKDGNVLVRRWLPESIYAAPAIGDLDQDGDLEIVTGTSWYWWNAHGQTEQPYVYAFDTSNVFDSEMHYSEAGKLPHLSGWPRPTAYPGFSSPALADVDEDGYLDVVIGSGMPSGMTTHCSGSPSDPDCLGAIYAWRYDGAPVTGFPVCPIDDAGRNSFIRSSPVVADIDNDSDLEIVFAMLWDVIVLGPDGTAEYVLDTNYSVFASPAVGDTDGDGYVEVWIGGSDYYDSSNGYLWRFESDTAGLGAMPWPMFHRDAGGTGYHPLAPRLNTGPHSYYFLHQYGGGSTEEAGLSIENTGDGSLVWGVSATPASVSVNPMGGTAFYTQTDQADVTVTTTGYVTGTYDLGSVVITGTVGGVPASGSPASISITLYVGEVHEVHLPLVMRSFP